MTCGGRGGRARKEKTMKKLLSPFEFGKTMLTSLPELTNTYSKKGYACYFDETTDNYLLFYTSNGRSFRKVAECENITAVHKNYLEAIVDDLLS